MDEDIKITDLPSVGPATAEKLITGGFDTILSIAVAHPSNITDTAGVTEASARKIIKAARDSMGLGYVDGFSKEKEKSEKGYFISTSSQALDDILGGGVKSGIITEVYGQFGSSKTQWAHQLCVNTLIDNPDGKVVYIDTENTFTPLRIRQMCTKYDDIDPEDILKRILVAKAYNSDHQMLLAEQIETLIKQGNKVCLVIVDSLTAHFRAEYVGRGTLADRQGKINKHMSTLSKTADIYDVPVFVTNQVSANPGQFYGNPLQAIGGNIVGHSSKFRLFLRPGAKGTRVAKLVDSPYMPDAEATYQITEKGIEDV